MAVCQGVDAWQERTCEKDAANQTSSGLDRDYITQWSYGIGGDMDVTRSGTPKVIASVPLSQNSKAMEKADAQFMQIYQQLGQYCQGEQPGTSGPVYVGAFVLMLSFSDCLL